MRTFGLAIVVALAIAVIGLGIALYFAGFPSFTYRYRMTVNVLVGDEVRSGSSVIEVQIKKQPKILPNLPTLTTVRGEAVFLDLVSGRNVVAILRSGPKNRELGYPDNSAFPGSVVPTHFKLSYEDWDLVKYPHLRGMWALPESDLPAFITFADLNDRMTPRLVRPDEFERLFGNGVRLRDVTIEMTNDPITESIETKLPWLADLIKTGGALDGSRSVSTNSLTNNLGSRSFKQR